jgi:hypothetical protein
MAKYGLADRITGGIVWVHTSMGRREMHTVFLVGNTERNGYRRRYNDDITKSPRKRKSDTCRQDKIQGQENTKSEHLVIIVIVIIIIITQDKRRVRKTQIQNIW